MPLSTKMSRHGFNIEHSHLFVRKSCYRYSATHLVEYGGTYAMPLAAKWIINIIILLASIKSERRLLYANTRHEHGDEYCHQHKDVVTYRRRLLNMMESH